MNITLHYSDIYITFLPFQPLKSPCHSYSLCLHYDQVSIYECSFYFYTIFTFSTFLSIFITQVHYQEYGLQSQAYSTFTYTRINSLVRVIHVMDILFLSQHHVSPRSSINIWMNPSHDIHNLHDSWRFIPFILNVPFTSIRYSLSLFL